MKFVTVAEIAKQWGISESTVRKYCAAGRISGAFLAGSKWSIPANAARPERASKSCLHTLLDRLQAEKEVRLSGGIYHRVQIDLTYNSNNMEGNRLTHDQTRFLFETNTISASEGPVSVDDVLETSNHFRCIDWVIDNAERTLCEKDIKHLHSLLKNGTSDSRKKMVRCRGIQTPAKRGREQDNHSSGARNRGDCLFACGIQRQNSHDNRGSH